MTKPITDKEKKTVFAIINLANPEEQQINTATYAADLAQLLNLPLVLFPRVDQTKISFKEGFKRVHRLIRIQNFPFSVSKYSTSPMRSFNDIAVMEHAASIVMGVKEEKQPLVRKLFGNDIWSFASTSSAPVTLVPMNVKFNGFGEVTIAVDSENKVQKMKYLNVLARKAVVHVFVDNPSNYMVRERTRAVLVNIEKYLRNADLIYEIEEARNQENFSHHLLRFAKKNSQLLILEIDKKRINAELREHIQEFLFGANQNFAIMLVKTKALGRLSWR